MNTRFISISIWIVFISNSLIAQIPSIKGTIVDAESKETLIGCTAALQGTTLGAITNFDGIFELYNIAPGAYNLVISYVSYEQQIIRVEVLKNQTTAINVLLKPSTVVLDDIKIVATKRTNTELSVMSSIKAGNVVASGISSQQIAKSQDKDASEVIRRVPGINIRDGRFVVVRGLSERYNSVWLNNAAAPSSETDVRAFSFDMIPSSQIENLIIVKSPAPEMPADFAGGAIMITTKNNADENATHLSYSMGYDIGNTFKNSYTYQGSSTDWLGFDNGTRDLPNGFLNTAGIKDLHETKDMATGQEKTTEQIAKDHETATQQAQSFNKIWTPVQKTALMDQTFGFDITRRFLLGNVSVGTINAIMYNNGKEHVSVDRAGYAEYDAIEGRPNPLYSYFDEVYRNTVRIGGMSNWSFIFGNNQKIQFRNLLNQYGQSQTSLRNGKDFYNDFTIRTNELAYQSRTTYSGQLAGEHHTGNNNFKADWILGYSYANKKQPDIRRARYVKTDDESPYVLTIYNTVNPDLLGRIHMNNFEHIFTSALNMTQNLTFGDFKPEIKAGFYSEIKNREFSARNIGFIKSNSSQFDQNLPFQTIDTVFLDKNINYPTGITVAEQTSLSDSYQASNNLLAGYVGLKIPFYKFILYGGVRAEKNSRVLDGFDDSDRPVHEVTDTLNLFPSLNLSYNFTEKLVARAAYGKTINRPEFRETAPYSFYDFEENALFTGDTNLVNSYIDNYDLRLEWYPEVGDMVTLSAFYKKFENPIEAILTSSGTGWNYTYQNALKAESKGIELDIRKTLAFIPTSNFFTTLLHNTTIVFNTSLIESRLETSPDDKHARDSIRPMQGQAPYIVNLGLYYANEKGLSVSLLYNVVGKNLVFVGDDNYAHIYQMPFNDLELLVQKEFINHWKVKAGIKNLLNSTNTRQNMAGDKTVQQDQVTRQFKPGTTVNIGLTYTF